MGKPEAIGELELLDLVRSFVRKKQSRVVLGIGDDAALLRASGNLALSVDSQIEGVHFRRSWLTPEELAHRSFAAAVSDLSAMGARPLGWLCHLSVPADASLPQLRRLFSEQHRLSTSHACPLVGGNISRDQRFGLVATVVGEYRPEQPALLRSGAKPGDEVWLVGEVGKARLALLEMLKQDRTREGFFRGTPRDEQHRWGAFLRPQILLKRGAQLLERAHACIDLSDGLSRDAGRIAQESKVALALDEDALLGLVDASFQRRAHRVGEAALRTLLVGGEDYALLATGPAAKRPRFCRVIGSVEAGEGAYLRGSRGRSPLPVGHEH